MALRSSVRDCSTLARFHGITEDREGAPRRYLASISSSAIPERQNSRHLDQETHVQPVRVELVDCLENWSTFWIMPSISDVVLDPHPDRHS